ncbi:hypothetical protein GGU11DRAFT_453499 [Lentinula aff. detonsa]|nr:hypothetical protein GGU11DRAFT_453499 [Lentinula aff. detonsa]
MRIVFIGLLFSILLVIVNPVASVPLFGKAKKLPDMKVIYPLPVTSTISNPGTNRFRVDAFADIDCERKPLGTISGENIETKDLKTPKGKCLMFILPMPPQCKLQVERPDKGARVGPVQQFGGDYTQGTMIRGSFESITIICRLQDASTSDA